MNEQQRPRHEIGDNHCTRDDCTPPEHQPGEGICREHANNHGDNGRGYRDHQAVAEVREEFRLLHHFLKMYAGNVLGPERSVRIEVFVWLDCGLNDPEKRK